ncbi:hypothetical protein [Tabrizicola oligotrophica]|uniref:Uncharacterized protein n=1 Tax=Tabrizicola oligotrophica TaxID=2710650 RepID=A0A6M0QSS2_9RHOB|nr:hypothetical protein [Tabrizicola oligotrophica]NEY90529.1 hypothetical protein [Tabrizicola oligotrophica]
MSKIAKTGVVALPDGLKAWMQGQGPKVWHAFARGVEFDAPDATIDLLLAAHWIARQPDMDRATGLLLLARALQAGLHFHAPVAMDDAAARAFCLDLHQRLSLCAAPARLPVMPDEQALIEALSDGRAPLPLPPTALKSGIAPCAVTFRGNRPHMIATALRRTA